MHHPCREQLAERHQPKLRMHPLLRQHLRREVHLIQLSQTLRSQPLECRQQLAQRFTSRFLEHGEAVEWLESTPLAMLKNHPGTRNPIGLFSVNQMAQNIERTPTLSPFNCCDP